MSITSGIVLYAALWFLILLMLLPIGVRSQDESGDVTPGTPAGAPVDAMMRRKLIWATLAACVAWAVVFGVIVGRVITRDDIRSFAPFS